MNALTHWMAWRDEGRPDGDPRRLALRGANLRAADLRAADLRGADLRGAVLRGATGIVTAGPVGISCRMVYAVDHGDRVMVQAGCRWEVAEAVVEAIERDYADAPAMRDAYVAVVRAMVATLEAQRAALAAGGG